MARTDVRGYADLLQRRRAERKRLGYAAAKLAGWRRVRPLWRGPFLRWAGSANSKLIGSTGLLPSKSRIQLSTAPGSGRLTAWPGPSATITAAPTTPKCRTPARLSARPTGQQSGSHLRPFSMSCLVTVIFIAVSLSDHLLHPNPARKHHRQHRAAHAPGNPLARLSVTRNGGYGVKPYWQGEKLKDGAISFNCEAAN